MNRKQVWKWNPAVGLKFEPRGQMRLMVAWLRLAQTSSADHHPPPTPSCSPGEKLPAQTLSYRMYSPVWRFLNCPVWMPAMP